MKYTNLESLIDYCKYRQCEYCEFHSNEKKIHCYLLGTSPCDWDLKKIKTILRIP